MAFVYSCCFWFSLRLGGIIIGVFSLIQAILSLIALCIAHTRPQEVKDEITNLMNSVNLIFTKEYFESFRADPEKILSFAICIVCLYIIICSLYIYGAYTCNNILMIAFILGDLVRLILLAGLIAIWLLILKQNSMDIGLLIGASVGSGFFLLGMFYLWVCAANLPVLISEMERDEQAATIEKLKQLVEAKHRPIQNIDTIPLTGANPYRRGISHRNGDDNSTQSFAAGAKVQVPYYIR